MKHLAGSTLPEGSLWGWQRILDLMAQEEAGTLGEVDQEQFQKDLGTVYEASGMKIEDVLGALAQSGIGHVVIIRNRTTGQKRILLLR